MKMKNMIFMIEGGFFFFPDKWDWQSLGKNAECSGSEDMSRLVRQERASLSSLLSNLLQLLHANLSWYWINNC